MLSHQPRSLVAVLRSLSLRRLLSATFSPDCFSQEDGITTASWQSRITGTRSAHSLREKLTLVAMPQLSPNMTSGSVRRWLKEPGEEISTYDVVMEVDTDNLSEEAYKVGDFAGTVTMLVEAQEDGFLSNILVEEGRTVDVNTPLATMCESEETLKELAASSDEVQKLLERPEELRGMTWQSYLKESSEGPKGCN